MDTGVIMKVLIVSSNRYQVPNPVFPIGPAYVAGAAVEAGHEVEVFDCCFAENVAIELERGISRFNPDVIGFSIRNVSTGLMFSHRSFRQEVKEITDSIRRISSAPIVLGGPGFNNFGCEWLEYLGLDYGIRGEAELTFPIYLRLLEEGGNIHGIPGSVFRKDDRIYEVHREFIDDLDATPFPAFYLFDLERYVKLGAFPALSTQRGCSFCCSYCPRSFLEGTQYRLKSAKRVVDEVEHIRNTGKVNMFYFADNSFNFPISHAEDICLELIKRKLEMEWTTDCLLPLGMTEGFCHLLKDAGCTLAILAVESGSAKMLKNMNRRYSPEHIKEAIENLKKVGLPVCITLLLGGPGETMETISETINLIDNLPEAQMTLVTIGLALEHHMGILADARRDCQLREDSELFEGAYYLSPELSKNYVEELIDYIRAKPNWVFFES